MSEKPTLFVSAPATTDTTALRSVLKKLGASVTDVFDFKPGDSLSGNIIARISKSDGVIIVHSEKSNYVAFEAGISVALKKPMLVLVDPNCEVPAFVQSMLYLKSKAEDTPILRASLTRFIQDIISHRLRPRGQRKSDQKEHAGKERTSDYAEKIRQWRGQPTAILAEKLVADVLKDAGLQVESSSARDAGVDCVIWSDRLAQTLGNPILVEVKVGNLDSSRLDQAELQLQHYLNSSEAHYGILLYLDKQGRRFPERRSKNPTILRLDLEDFVRQLQQHSFEELVLTERNRLVHGGGLE